MLNSTKASTPKMQQSKALYKKVDAMFWKKKKTESDLEKVVKELACYFLEYGLNDQFRELACDRAGGLKLSNYQEFQSMLHNPPKEAEIYSAEKHGLGGWLSACQFSIFELVYNCGESALPFIRKIAWGEYDWTQGNAIEVLVRLASKGIQRNEIIKEIKENFPKIRYEAQLYSIQSFLPRLDSDQDLRSVVSKLMEVEDFKESYEELIEKNA